MIFNTIEFLDSANKPLPVPDRVRLTPHLTRPPLERQRRACPPQRTPMRASRMRIGLAKPPSILHTAANKPLGKRQNKP